MSTDASRDRDEIVEVMRGGANKARLCGTTVRNILHKDTITAILQAALSALEAKGYVVEKVSASHGIRHRREGFEDGTGSRSRAPHPSRDATKDTA